MTMKLRMDTKREYMKWLTWLIMTRIYFPHSFSQQDLFIRPRHYRISFSNASAHRAHPCSLLFLAVLRKICWQALLFVQLLGHGVQSDVRVRHRFLQEFLLQCYFQHAQDLAAGCGRRHITVRMHQISHETHHIKPNALFHGVSVHSLDILPLLWMVGLSQLLQRWFLLTMEPPNILYGKLFTLFNSLQFEYFPTCGISLKLFEKSIENSSFLFFKKYILSSYSNIFYIKL